MLIGHGVSQLEQRITDALCSGSLRPRESDFLQNISRKIGLYREGAFLTNSQASWLYTILTSFEQGTKSRSSKTRTPAGSRRAAPPPSSLRSPLEIARADLDGHTWTGEEPPKGFDISEAIEPERSI